MKFLLSFVVFGLIALSSADEEVRSTLNNWKIPNISILISIQNLRMMDVGLVQSLLMSTIFSGWWCDGSRGRHRHRWQRNPRGTCPRQDLHWKRMRVSFKNAVWDGCRSISYKWIGLGWKSPGGVKYRAAYAANNIIHVCEIDDPSFEVSNKHACYFL